MRILVVTPEYPPFLFGGLGRYVCEIIPCLRNVGVDLIVLCVPSYAAHAPSLGLDLVDEPGSAITIVDEAFVDILSAQTIDVQKYIAICKKLVDKLICQLDGPFDAIFIQDFSTIGISKYIADYFRIDNHVYFAHLPLSARFSYFDMPVDGRRHFLLESATIAWADRILVASAFARRTLSAIYPVAPSRIAVLPLATVRRCERAPEKAGGSPLITAIGRMTDQKGWAAFLDLVEALESLETGYHYAVVGQGPRYGAVAERLSALLPNSRLELHQTLAPLHGIPELLSKSAIYAQLSAYETFGLAALEAAAHGAVPVVFAVGGLCELFPPQSGAFLVEPGDIGQVAAIIGQLLTTPEGVSRSEQVMNYATAYSWRAHVSALLPYLDPRK